MASGVLRELICAGRVLSGTEEIALIRLPENVPSGLGIRGQISGAVNRQIKRVKRQDENTGENGQKERKNPGPSRLPEA